MDPGTRKLAGWVVAAVGAVITLVALLADQIGLGDDEDAFGGRQVAMLVVGLVILAIGLFVALAMKDGETSEEATTTKVKTDGATPAESSEAETSESEAAESDAAAKANEPEESDQVDDADEAEEQDAAAEAEAAEETSDEAADNGDDQADEESTTKKS